MRRAALFALTVAVMVATEGHAETARLVGEAEERASSPGLEGLARARQARWSWQDERARALAAEAAEALEGRQQGHALVLVGISCLELQRWDEALEALTEAATLLPELDDRLALARGEALLRSERYPEAIEAYEAALGESQIEQVAMHAEVGLVRAMLACNARGDLQRAARLLARYPSLPEKHEIEHEMARSIERRGRKAAAYVRYRKLWLNNADSDAAQRSRERIEVLADNGLRIAPVRHTEHLSRIRQLIADRQFDRAEREIAATLHTAKGSVQHHLQLELAILAYRRGELDRSRALLLDLQDRRGPTGPWLERVDLASGETSTTIRRITKGYAVNSRTAPGKLVRVAEVHLDAGEYQEARRALSFVKLSRAPGFLSRWLPWISMKAGDWDAALPGLSRLHEERWSRGRRSYFIGRAHHESDRPCDARAAYEDTIRADPHGYYALWARQRLRALGTEVDQAQEAEDAEELRCPAPTEEDPEATAAWTPPDPLMDWHLDPRRQATPTMDQGLEAIDQLIEDRGESLPWLGRARDLWLAGDIVGAGEELHQVLWSSRGFLAPTVGLSRLWGGRPRVYRPRGWRPSRFTDEQVDRYVTVTEAVGEVGLGLQAKRPPWSDLEGWHPLAFEPMVRAAAGRHELEPELLWGIMRVESYFNRHAISHAHALGLMQILPRTGRRVARQVEAEHFEVSDLLSPRRGLDFSASYLRALSDRFHGQWPLMIAAYNGGPHNVASWITRRTDTDQPLLMDEFVEEIPFSETYRYVHRVLGSIAIYHALAGMPPPELPLLVDRDVAAGVNF